VVHLLCDVVHLVCDVVQLLPGATLQAEKMLVVAKPNGPALAVVAPAVQAAAAKA